MNTPGPPMLLAFDGDQDYIRHTRASLAFSRHALGHAHPQYPVFQLTPRIRLGLLRQTCLLFDSIH